MQISAYFMIIWLICIFKFVFHKSCNTKNISYQIYCLYAEYRCDRIKVKKKSY